MLGIEAEFFGTDKALIETNRVEENKLLLNKVASWQPDLCFFCLHKDEILPDTIKKISSIPKVVTLNWFADDHWRFDNYSKNYAPYFNWVVTTYSKAVEKYHQIGYHKVIHSQWAADIDIYKPVTTQKDIDVSFVGIWNKNRDRVIKKLKQSGIRVETWGQGWSAGRLGQDEMIKVLARSKISLGLNTPSTYYGLKPLVGFFFRRRGRFGFKQDFKNIWSNFREWRQKRIPMIKARMFEIPACGALLFTQAADNIGDYYIDGKEMVLYDDDFDLIKKLQYYLQHDCDRETLSQAGYERTINEHNYESRFNDIFNIIGLKV
jgi:spore maturation protein CgeB